MENVVKFPNRRRRGRSDRPRRVVAIDEQALDTICGWHIDLAERLNLINERIDQLERRISYGRRQSGQSILTEFNERVDRLEKRLSQRVKELA